ncbi:MAG: CocE/NonD family hydrolase [Actinomycetota bacterium]|nr:CocE/NonD family hydrolase [Actinomycetota bacterium]
MGPYGREMLTRLVLLSALVFGLVVNAGQARAAEPPPGSVWTEHYFPSEDGITMLHADVLRPKGLDEDDKTPVILSASPYFNHAGDPLEYQPGNSGPSPRFYDFVDLTNIFERGYTYVMVDLPGFGGSGGCNDWGGVREQQAVKAAVEWAASQSWSTGAVGMMGKSYDAWTGLMGIAQQPKGLKAVVAMEPVYSGYRYLYNNGVRFFNSLGTPAIFLVEDAKPGSTRDTPQYLVNGAPQAWCYGINYSLQQQDDPDSPFWAERDLLRMVEGAKTPLFLTQGFLETNTKPDGAFDFFNLLDGPNRAWYGQFNHVRGWEQDGKNKYAMGRDSFVGEMMRFFDHHLKGAPRPRDPVIEVQDALGRYRAEPSWPPPDAKMWWSKLNTGTYTDDGFGGGTVTEGLLSVSPPLAHDVWLSGEPVVRVELDAVPRANLVALVYDIDPKGDARLVSRGAHLIRGAMTQNIKLELYGQDWPFKEGHRIGVQITDADSSWWLHVGTRTDVTVTKVRVGFPFLTYARTAFIEGGPTLRLKDHMEDTMTVGDGVIRDARIRFTLPPPLRARAS